MRRAGNAAMADIGGCMSENRVQRADTAANEAENAPDGGTEVP